MIVGIGTDLVDQRRIARLYTKYGDRFAARILMPDEHEAFLVCSQPENFLAKAWACKEALAKALGTGFSGLAHDDIGVVRDQLGAPKAVFSSHGSAQLKALGGTAALVSISDEPPMVLAFAVIQGGISD